MERDTIPWEGGPRLFKGRQPGLEPGRKPVFPLALCFISSRWVPTSIQEAETGGVTLTTIVNFMVHRHRRMHGQTTGTHHTK